jgi:anaerobic carbon-monoxide dehydrogenase iron sulfur subunit
MDRPNPRGCLIVDTHLCHGCQSCMVACSLTHEGRVIPTLSRIRVLLDAFSGTHRIIYCHQCDDAACAAACPQEAITLSTAGYWWVESDLCIGCGACLSACLFEALWLDEARGLAIKCDTCQGAPACVASCPRGALTWQVEE